MKTDSNPAELARAVVREVLADNRTAFISDLADMVHHGMTYKNSLTKIIEAALIAHGQAERERALEEAAKVCESTDWPRYAEAIRLRILELKQRSPKS